MHAFARSQVATYANLRIHAQATPKAIKKLIHEADSQSRVKVNKYIDNRLSYSCSYVHSGSEGGGGDGDGNILETLRSLAMFCFRRVVVYNLTCVRKKACTQLCEVLVRPTYVHTRSQMLRTRSHSRNVANPLRVIRKLFFAQYRMTVKSWLLEK